MRCQYGASSIGSVTVVSVFPASSTVVLGCAKLIDTPGSAGEERETQSSGACMPELKDKHNAVVYACVLLRGGHTKRVSILRCIESDEP